MIIVVAFSMILILYIHFRAVAVGFVYTFCSTKQIAVPLDAGRQLLNIQVTTPNLMPQFEQETAGLVDEFVPIHAAVLLTLKVYSPLQPRSEATANRLRGVVVTVHGLLLCTLGRCPWLQATGYGRVVDSVCLTLS